MNNNGQHFTLASEDGGVEVWTTKPHRGKPIAKRPRAGSFQRISFAALWLFTLMLYARPNDLFPDQIGLAPVEKYIAIIVVVTFLVGTLTDARRQRWPLEVQIVLLITAIAVILMPFAESPSRSLEFLLNTWLKVVCIFYLLVNLIDNRHRLRMIMTLIVACGTVLAVDAIRSYAIGDLRLQGANGSRIIGAVGGMFFDPNDLATTFNILLPMAIALGLTSRGLRRLMFPGSDGEHRLSVVEVGQTYSDLGDGFTGRGCPGSCRRVRFLSSNLCDAIRQHVCPAGRGRQFTPGTHCAARACRRCGF